MNASRVRFVTVSTLLILATAAGSAEPSFEKFHERAQKGEHLTVVFFGASLTWGANASDQAYTSYRARVAEKLQATYPQAHFTFHDAAIGGTGSQLGVFRLQRDVLNRKPDLVFLDFSANDDIYGSDAEKNASYESLVRRIIVDGQCPLVQVLFPFGWNAHEAEFPKMKRRESHLKIAAAYHTGVGDAIALATDRIKSGDTTLPKIWPFDQVHPGDEGYQLFADAAWQAFQKGVETHLVCAAPEKMLYDDTYMSWSRNKLSQFPKLPQGWYVVPTLRTAAYQDALMSRWLDDEVRVANWTEAKEATGKKGVVELTPEPLKVRFNGAMVFLFGTKTEASCKYRILIDGALVQCKNNKVPEDTFEASSGGVHANTHLSQLIATGLDPKITHELTMEPVFEKGSKQELRFESLCIAGGEAKILP